MDDIDIKREKYEQAMRDEIEENIRDAEKLQEKQKAKKGHEKAQDWTNVIYDIIKKGVIGGIGVVSLISFSKLLVFGTTNGISIDNIIQLYDTLLQSSKVEYIAVSTAVIFVARSLFMFIDGRQKGVDEENAS